MTDQEFTQIQAILKNAEQSATAAISAANGAVSIASGVKGVLNDQAAILEGIQQNLLAMQAELDDLKGGA